MLFALNFRSSAPVATSQAHTLFGVRRRKFFAVAGKSGPAPDGLKSVHALAGANIPNIGGNYGIVKIVKGSGRKKHTVLGKDQAAVRRRVLSQDVKQSAFGHVPEPNRPASGDGSQHGAHGRDGYLVYAAALAPRVSACSTPSATFHRRTTPSLPAEASVLPSGKKQTR